MNAPPNQPPLVSDPSIYTFPSIVYPPVHPPVQSIFLIGLVIAGIGIILFIVGVFLPRSQSTVSELGVAMLILGAVLGIPGFFIHAAIMGPLVRRFSPFLQDRPWDERTQGGANDHLYADQIGALLFHSSLPTCGSAIISPIHVKRAWLDVTARAARIGIPMPRCIVSDRLLPECRAIPLTEDLLEAEDIFSRKGMSRRVRFIAVPVFFLIVVLTVAVKAWFLTIIYLLAMLSAITGNRRSLRTRNFIGIGAADPIAACGVITTSSRRWTCHDSTMLVQARPFSAAPQVTLFGPSGVLTLHFPSVKDQDFISLWQRWNHLEPKPELLE